MASSFSFSSSSSSSSPNQQKRYKYDVFLSFRGEDTRDQFVSHLRNALIQKGIKTSLDYELQKGDEISPALIKAIEESKIAVIIFSENYANSSWCLDELMHILRCKEEKKQLVIPVFYHIRPSHVRKQTGSYEIAFSALEKRFEAEMDKVENWRKALTETANLAGWDSSVIRQEAEFVKKIVKDILVILKSETLRNGDKGLVGIHKRIEKIEPLLYIPSSDFRGRCCSIHNWCGSTAAYCSRGNCQYQCWNAAYSNGLPCSTTQLLNGSTINSPISKIISESLFNEMFKHMKDCPSQGFYNYEAFITAAASFPGFGTTGDAATRKRELAAFFAQTCQATTASWSDYVEPHAWGYCHVNETPISSFDENVYYSTPSHWPCASGQKYNSRGPVQLPYNYNYGLAGEALGLDLINHPDLVATDPVVSFETAIWFWMTQHDDKPSCHDILINAFEASHQVPSYGVIGNIINGADMAELAGGTTSSTGYYKRYCDMLAVTYGDNLNYWYEPVPF